jgi:two-component system, response regulator RegA
MSATEMIESETSLPTLMLVDDDTSFCDVLAAAFTARGMFVRVAHNVPQAKEIAASDPPEYAVIDLRMPGQSGLELVKFIKGLAAHTRMVVFTGYASVATAVEAIKLGATHYLAKPADADEIMAALHRDTGVAEIPVNRKPLSVARMEWEHIQRVLAECNDNISEASRRLHMHRRTLQRKLAKRPR